MDQKFLQLSAQKYLAAILTAEKTRYYYLPMGKAKAICRLKEDSLTPNRYILLHEV